MLTGNLMAKSQAFTGVRSHKGRVNTNIGLRGRNSEITWDYGGGSLSLYFINLKNI